MIRRLLVAVVTALVVTTAAVGSPAQSQAAWYDGACTDNVGVTVVVDFQELGGGVNIRCVPGPATSGLDALAKAGVAWEGTLRFPGFVCRIAGKPGPDTEPCATTPPDSAYWTYWIAPRGGSWCYSTSGAGARTPPAGTVEGWSFALNRTTSSTPSPRSAPPPPIAGQAPAPLNPSDCGVPTEGLPETTASTAPPLTTAPTTPPPAPPATTARPTPTVATTTPGIPGGASPGGVVGPDPGGVAGGTTVAPQPGTTSAIGTTTTVRPGTATTVGTATTTDRRTTTTPSDEDDDRTLDVAGGANDSAVPLGSVDLGDDGRGGGGFGASTALGILLVAALAAAGIVAARRRRSKVS